jgi:hypothetical protein
MWGQIQKEKPIRLFIKLILWKGVFLEDLTILQLVKKFPDF